VTSTSKLVTLPHHNSRIFSDALNKTENPPNLRSLAWRERALTYNLKTISPRMSTFSTAFWGSKDQHRS
jgi:hypothetical protein